jgi:hypothetical protein
MNYWIRPGIVHTLERFEMFTCDQFGIEPIDGSYTQALGKKTRKKEIVLARYVMMSIYRELFPDSVARRYKKGKNYDVRYVKQKKPLEVIGSRYGKDHATVLHGMRVVSDIAYSPYDQYYIQIKNCLTEAGISEIYGYNKIQSVKKQFKHTKFE